MSLYEDNKPARKLMANTMTHNSNNETQKQYQKRTCSMKHNKYCPGNL